MLTRLAHGAIRSPEQLEKLEKEVMKRIEEGLAGGQVKWLANYAVLGPYDYLDIFEAPDIEAAMKVSCARLAMRTPRSGRQPNGQDSRRSSAVCRAAATEPKVFIRSGSDDRLAEWLPRFGFRETG